jgi:hypothetical protein
VSIDTVRIVFAEFIEPDDELDLDGDEYGDNPQAQENYATVEKVRDTYEDHEPYVLVVTDQGTFNFPASHQLRVKVQ